MKCGRSSSNTEGAPHAGEVVSDFLNRMFCCLSLRRAANSISPFSRTPALHRRTSLRAAAFSRTSFFRCPAA